jgi:hypothetical protein
MTSLLVSIAMIGTVVLIKHLVNYKQSDVDSKPQHQRVIKKTN